MSGRDARVRKTRAGRAKGKAAATSSSHDTAVQFERFHSEEAQALYESQFKKRTMVIERAVTLSELTEVPFDSIPTILRSRQWEYFSRPPVIVYPELVREFYSNIISYNGDSVGLVSRVRGREVHITPDMISEFTGIPRVATPGFPFSDVYGPDKWTVGKAFHPAGGWLDQNHSFPTGEMAPHVALLARIVQNNLYPVEHHSDINFSRARFLYAMLVDVSIDFCSFALDIMWEVKQNKKASIAYPALITSLLLSLDVPISALEPVQAPKGPFSLNTARRSSAQIKRRRHGDPDASSALPRAPPATAPTGPSASIEGIMGLLQSMQLDFQTSRGEMLQAYATIQTQLSSIQTQFSSVDSRLSRIEGFFPSHAGSSTQPSSAHDGADSSSDAASGDSDAATSDDDGGDDGGDDSGDEARTKALNDI